MRTAGIIMECNPFHNGHRYIIGQARRIAEGGPVVVVMSGNFAQRGIPAVISWEERARSVLEAGADIVLELPVSSALSGAERFALGGVQLLNRTGIVTDLVFGSESADVATMIRNADFLLREPPEYRRLLRQKASQGLSYPAARTAAAAECPEHVMLPSSPNDLLGTEYCRALMQQGLLLRPEGAAAPQQEGLPVSDAGLPQHSGESPSLIRPHAIRRISGDCASSLRLRMQEEGRGLSADDFSGLLLEKLLAVNSGSCRYSFTDYLDVSQDLANRITRLLPQFVSWTQFCCLLKTRNLTYTAVSRTLMHILLDITAGFDKPAEPAYARVLGCRRASLSLLGRLKENGLILITRRADANLLPEGSAASESFRLDIRAAQTWELVRRMTLGSTTGEDVPSSPVSEFSRPLLILS